MPVISAQRASARHAAVKTPYVSRMGLGKIWYRAGTPSGSFELEKSQSG